MHRAKDFLTLGQAEGFLVFRFNRTEGFLVLHRTKAFWHFSFN